MPRAVAVVRRRGGDGDGEGVEGEDGVDLEVVEIVKWKIVFSSRPEPVGLT